MPVSWRRAAPAGLLLNDMKRMDGTTRTATAVDSAMRIRTAPPFVGRVVAPGSARCWRAPAIAFAPRTVSGKASSVLACRRRVCGRFSTAQVVIWLFVVLVSVGCARPGREARHVIDGLSGSDRLFASGL